MSTKKARIMKTSRKADIMRGRLLLRDLEGISDPLLDSTSKLYVVCRYRGGAIRNYSFLAIKNHRGQLEKLLGRSYMKRILDLL